MNILELTQYSNPYFSNFQCTGCPNLSKSIEDGYPLTPSKDTWGKQGIPGACHQCQFDFKSVCNQNVFIGVNFR